MAIQDKTRRTELGKMFIDIAKYVFTIVVIGGLFSERVDVGAIAVGALLASGLAGIGFLTIPTEEEKG